MTGRDGLCAVALHSSVHALGARLDHVVNPTGRSIPGCEVVLHQSEPTFFLMSGIRKRLCLHKDSETCERISFG